MGFDEGLAHTGEVQTCESEDLSIVDVGCGTGEFLRRLIDHLTTNPDFDEENGSYNLFGIEPSKEMLQQAEEKFANQEGENRSNVVVTLKQSAAEYLPLNDESADIILSTNAFHFFRNKNQSLHEMKRVLKQDGTLIITDWCNDYWIVTLYHFLERIRWNWRFKDRYPGPLTSPELIELVTNAGYCQIEHTTYRVRVFAIFSWGMQTIRATKR